MTRCHIGLIAMLMTLSLKVNASGKAETLKVPYRRPGSAIGGGSYSGVVLEAEKDKAANTCAIITAISARSAGLLQAPADGLEAQKPYKTDYARITETEFNEYNQANPDLKLAPGPLYAVTYEVAYEIRKSFVLYQIKSRLFYGGRDSEEWYEYKKKYDDAFFSRQLLASIEQRFGSCAARK
jgi:hypothetical protein